MQKKAFLTDWRTLEWISSDDGKEIEIPDHNDEIENPNPCRQCGKNTWEFLSQVQILKDCNDILYRMLGRQAEVRPSARELKGIWQRWEE